MAFQSMMSGAECAAGANPLSQVLKHAENDRSLQQDRIAGPSGSRLHHLPPTAAGIASEHDQALARQFFESGPANAFERPIMDPALAFQHSALPQMSSGLANSWKTEQGHPSAIASHSAQWATEFGQPVNGSAAPLSQAPSAQMTAHTSFQPRPFQAGFGGQLGMGMFPMGMGASVYPTTAGSFDQKGKGKIREADFEAAFAQLAAESLLAPQTSTSKIEEVTDSVANIEDMMSKTTLENPELRDAEFLHTWNEMQNSSIAPPQDDLAKWEAEYSALMNAERDGGLDYDYGAGMQQAWESGLGNYDEPVMSENPTKFSPDGIPTLDGYVFEKSNQFLDPSNSSQTLLSDAKALLEQNGSLTEAALMLEAAIQKGDTGEGSYEAWILLGETRNMDEREEAGMRALMEGVRIGEAAGANGVGMLSLAISYTNESYDRASYTMLLRWIRARFPDLPVPQDTVHAVSNNSTWDVHPRITDLLLGIARNQHGQGVIDPDVQIALGILFYTNSEYGRAKDCFEAALSIRPNDYLLWNRLGSSLSNGNNPEEALGAYREALQLRPTYTRAIYNVGVACLNIGAHKEGAEHFLSALAMQEANGGGDTSSQLWFTLRRALSAVERPDLAQKAQVGAKVAEFRGQGFDF